MTAAKSVVNAADSAAWDKKVRQLLTLPEVSAALARFDAILEEVAAEIKAISEVPAPPFHESERARFVAEKMKSVGLTDVHVDEAPNPIGIYPAADGSQGEALLLAAHIDTVFPPETDVTVTRSGAIMQGAGVGDNASNVGAILAVARVLREQGFKLPREVIFVGTAGEEGLGDLRGMKQAMKTYKDRVRWCLPVDGSLGGVTHGAVGSRRYDIVVHGPGGHSYGAFGAPSAIHALGRMIAAISDVQVPEHPRTTYNVGVIKGGTSVNTIAPEAAMLLDMRSESADELERLEAEVVRRIDSVAKLSKVTYDMKLVGDRPAGALSVEHDLPQMVMAAGRSLGIECHPHASSTDSNVPIGMGIPSVTMGTSHKGNSHRVDDWFDIPSLATGMKHLLLCVLLGTGYKE